MGFKSNKRGSLLPSSSTASVSPQTFDTGRMEALFNTLKKQPPVNKYIKDFPPSLQIDADAAFKRHLDSLIPFQSNPPTLRRESMPPQSSTVLLQKSKKNHSVSQTKMVLKTKPFRIRIERNSFLLLEGHRTENRTANKDIGKLQKTKNMTPTKAQQKLFDPEILVRAHKLKEFKIKRCEVRVQRLNLALLRQQLAQSVKKRIANKNSPSATPKTLKLGHKRTDSSTSPSALSCSPAKRGRPSKKVKDSQSSFYIKLDTVRTSLTPKRATPTKGFKTKLPGKVATPTKFTRTHLEKTFGKQPFRSFVRIRRCMHPQMVTFESNARARQLTEKQTKSKNLTVSFKAQVEIFGNSDDDSDAIEEDDIPSTSQAALCKASVNSVVPVMPARSTKVEDGKVIDDIELGQALFIGPITDPSSTALVRKKREKKSFSLLKDDGMPSLQKERLKLANEKLPPNGLTRLNIDDIDDEDYGDDECEYIVPTDIPEKRTSYPNSINKPIDEITSDGSEIAGGIVQPLTRLITPPLKKKEDSCITFAFAIDKSNTVEVIPNVEEQRLNSPLSIVPEEKPAEIIVADKLNFSYHATTDKITSVEIITEQATAERKKEGDHIQHIHEYLTATQTSVVENTEDDEEGITDEPPAALLSEPPSKISKNSNNSTEASTDKYSLNGINEVEGDVSTKLNTKIDDDDLSLNLFVEDSQTIPSNFIDGVDNIVNELSKDIEMEAKAGCSARMTTSPSLSMDYE